MVRADDAYDEWFDERDRPYAGRAGSRDAHPLEVVRPARLAFELIAPASFEEAQTIAARIRAGTPVVVDLRGCEARLAGRLLDFCSGLVYAIEGRVQLIGDEVVLLTPSHVDVSGDEASGIREPGFFNRI